MKTPYFNMTPDYSPVVRMMAMQTVFAVETTQKMFELAMLPWKGLPTPYGLMRAGLCVSNPAAGKAMPAAPSTVDAVVKEARKVAERAEAAIEAASEKAEVQTEKAAAAPVAKQASAAPKAPVAPKAVAAAPKPTPKPMAPAPTGTAKKADAAPAKAEPAVAPKPAAATPSAVPAAEAPVAAKPLATEANPVEQAVAATVAAMVEPQKLAAPEGAADDLTALNGVGPKLAEALNAQGIWHYHQIAGWTEANVAWVDENLPGVRGRASRNGWVGQATALQK